MKAGDVLDALRRHHAANKGWVTVSEVRIGTGWGGGLPMELRLAREQRIDMFALGTWQSTQYERIAYEVKVSRSDLLRELADPTKRRGAEMLAHRFRFACPTGLMKRSELPEGCGLVEIRDDGSVYTFRSGAYHERGPLPEAFTASLLRTAADQRSMGERCGARRCHIRAGWFRYPTRRRWGAVLAIPLCKKHVDEWDRYAEEVA